MGRIIGIDLGTTNSIASYWDGHKSVLIPNRLGEYLTPSVVCIENDGTVIVGKSAKKRQLTNPELCVSNFKRGMGTDTQYIIAGKIFNAEDLSALILKSLREDAERFLKEPVEEAVISVPAYFADKARKATRKAGLLAGLKVERIVNEPSAAALAFRELHKDVEGKILVFDFGGGTLDVSLVDCFKNVVEIIAVSGDNQLGGIDFDKALARNYSEKLGTPFVLQDTKTQQLLLRNAERAKRVLTVEDYTNMRNDSYGFTKDCNITRKDFIRMSTKVFERIGKPVKRVLQDAKIRVSELNGVVLVGGSCKMTIVQEYIRFLLKGASVEAVHPDIMVAMGVGAYAGMKEHNRDVSDLILTDICPFSLGTGVANAVDSSKTLMDFIIPRNSALPSSRENTYCTAYDNQTSVTLGIYQGEDLYAANNIKLDEIHFKDIPPRPKGEESISLRFTYDINGILLVDAVLLSRKEKHNLILGVDDDSEETKKRIEMLKQLKNKQSESEESKFLQARAERLYQQLNDFNIKNMLASKISNYVLSLKNQNLYEIQKEGEALLEFLNKIEREYLSEYEISDEYMDDFLKWYEDHDEDENSQDNFWRL